ncbi:surfeit locus 1 family protein [Roseibium sp. TrichSKD4]|uniref:SURF1 family protein n=1 Tax=Roseibium sp. TrichSKD4 TaxID=744980 RepID=UPI0001E5620D|nr:SURF1 family protein [Roseibium sp. TrichSKD4]EFO34474.1 surfeit locus 1 family protein [Roseibium sp. TrichSKD4]
MSDKAAAQGSRKSIGRPLIIPTIAAVVGFLVLLNLGFWQLDRLEQKNALIERVEAGVSSKPVPVPAPDGWDELSLEDDYKNVFVTGRFVGDPVFYYTALTKSVGKFNGPGYLIYSPFKTEGGWHVMINRGYIPQDLPEEVRQAAIMAPEGFQKLTGLLRVSEKPSWTTPAADPKSRIWFARDTDGMAEMVNLKTDALAPFSIDLANTVEQVAELPQAGETVVRFKNDHLGYALTWFGLAATLAGVYLAFVFHMLRQRHI